eukprot:scaffold1375_cov255-Pinguiococcus_pyrenoidosus.AAC.11
MQSVQCSSSVYHFSGEPVLQRMSLIVKARGILTALVCFCSLQRTNWGGCVPSARTGLSGFRRINNRPQGTEVMKTFFCAIASTDLEHVSVQETSVSKAPLQQPSEAGQTSPTSPATPDFSEKLSEHTVANLNRSRPDSPRPRTKTPIIQPRADAGVGKENMPLDNHSGGSKNSMPPTPQLKVS